MWIHFTDGTSFIPQSGDTFFLGFNGNYFLRESCYRCKYCGTKRVADFTIGDFWGVDPKKLPPDQMKVGVSLMLCNTERARNMIDELERELVIEPVGPEEAIPYNGALSSPQTRPAIRDTFFEQMERRGFDPVIRSQHKKLFLKIRIKCVLRKILPMSVLKKIVKNPY